MKESIKKIHEQFETINFSTFYLVFDPLLEKLCCTVNICFEEMFCFKRIKILKKAEDKFSRELEVSNILNKVRTTHQMLKNFQMKEQSKFIKYNEDYLINYKQLSTDTEVEKEFGLGDNAKAIELDLKYAFGASIL